MRFRVRWPDDTVTSCYSPSRVVRDFLTPGRFYVLADFVARSRAALTVASERVRRKYGFPCGAAAAQLAAIEEQASRFEDRPDAGVVIESFEE
jgi:uncharacterized repeat protein (TIGR04042 family)